MVAESIKKYKEQFCSKCSLCKKYRNRESTDNDIKNVYLIIDGDIKKGE